MLLRMLLSADFAVPVAVGGLATWISYDKEHMPKSEKMKRVCLYQLATKDTTKLQALRDTVESFNDLEGIKATFHQSDKELDKEYPLRKSHTHCLMVIASSRDTLKDFLHSKEHEVTFAKQLLEAGNSQKEMGVFDGPLTVIRC